MSQPENPDTTSPTPVDAAPAAPAAGTSPEPLNATEVAESSASASPHEHETDADTDADAGEDAGEEAAAGAGGEATAEAGAAPAKRKRRRRRKKKPAGAEGATAEGASAEGTAAASGEAEAGVEGASAEATGGAPHPQGQKPRKPKKEKAERERPAFNVGDVVFGKVLEFTEDALFVDLSGKAKAIFDLRELLITEDEAEEYARADKKEREEREAEAAARAAAEAAAKAANGAAAPSAPASAEPDATPSEASAPVSVEAALSEAAPTESTPAVGGVAESSVAVSDTATAEGAPGEDKAPNLPRVILEPGAPFVGLVHNDGGRGGLVVLTHHPKRVSKTKPVIAEASRSGALVFGLVTGVIKGGLEIDVDGLRAFAPASHVDLRPGADLHYLIGKRLGFAVTQYAKRGRDVVLSRRALLEAEAKEKREEALKHLEMGAVVDGVVRTVVPFGAFVDVGGVEGLVPLSEMSHNRADQPKDVFKVGETTRVKIMRVDEKGKLWLSRKAAIEDPWAQVAQKYATGTKHKGKVARLQPFGAFIELEPGIDGLVHTADLSVKRIEHPQEVLKIGDEIDVVVANVDPKQHRIALHPAPTGEAANEIPQRIQIHKSVKVVVVSVDTPGLTVRVLGATGRNARGFISASATGTPRGTELRKLFPPGKELEAKVVEHDPRRGELKLSIKALNEDNERNAYQQYRAQVKREAKFGTLADLLAKRNITPGK